MSGVFEGYSEYYNLFYRDKDYRGEVEYIEQLLQRYGADINTILEFGSGTGIHANLLAEKGYRISGVELSEQMVAQAKTSEYFSCRQGDIRSVNLQSKFDAVLSLFHVISYQVNNDDVINTFNNANRHLDTGGLFIFDIWYTPAVLNLQPEVKVKVLSKGDFEVTRIAQPVIHSTRNQVDVNYTVHVNNTATEQFQKFSETHAMRHFSIPEIELLGRICGFEIVTAERFLDGGEPSDESWGVCFVMKKTKK